VLGLLMLYAESPGSLAEAEPPEWRAGSHTRVRPAGQDAIAEFCSIFILEILGTCLLFDELLF